MSLSSNNAPSAPVPSVPAGYYKEGYLNKPTLFIRQSTLPICSNHLSTQLILPSHDFNVKCDNSMITINSLPTFTQIFSKKAFKNNPFLKEFHEPVNDEARQFQLEYGVGYVGGKSTKNGRRCRGLSVYASCEIC